MRPRAIKRRLKYGNILDLVIETTDPITIQEAETKKRTEEAWIARLTADLKKRGGWETQRNRLTKKIQQLDTTIVQYLQTDFGFSKKDAADMLEAGLTAYERLRPIYRFP